MENPIKMDDLGVPLFLQTHNMTGYLQIFKKWFQHITKMLYRITIVCSYETVFQPQTNKGAPT